MRVVPHFPKNVVILSDCQAAIAAAVSDACVSPILARRLQELMVEVRAGGTLLQLAWVPAHGRCVSGCLPPDGISECDARALNACVDTAARQRVLECLHASDREAWHQRGADARSGR